MSILGFIILLVVAAVVGSIGEMIAGYSPGGCLVSIVVGFIGAVIGVWLAGTFRLPEFFVLNIEGRPFPVIWGIIGAALFAGVLSLFARRSFA